MSEEKKINAQECLKLDQEELDQVAGGDAYTALLIFEQEDHWIPSEISVLCPSVSYSAIIGFRNNSPETFFSYSSMYCNKV